MYIAWYIKLYIGTVFTFWDDCGTTLSLNFRVFFVEEMHVLPVRWLSSSETDDVDSSTFSSCMLPTSDISTLASAEVTFWSVTEVRCENWVCCSSFLLAAGGSFLNRLEILVNSVLERWAHCFNLVLLVSMCDQLFANLPELIRLGDRLGDRRFLINPGFGFLVLALRWGTAVGASLFL